jgi:hypothetical protein
MRRATTLLTGLVVALLLALAGTSVASASTPTTEHASLSGHHATAPAATTVAKHRVASTPRPHVTVVGHLGHDLMLQVAPMRTTRTASEHEPVIATSFCSSDRAPPV